MPRADKDMQQTGEGQAELSVVVPLYNEEESLPQLVEQLLAALRPLQLGFELVLVDDGSKDGTAKVLSQLAATVPELVAVLLRRNYGQTAAMAARPPKPKTCIGLVTKRFMNQTVSRSISTRKVRSSPYLLSP